MQHQKILILDFGSQVTQLIARRVREAHVFCEVVPCDVSSDWIHHYAADGMLKRMRRGITQEKTEALVDTIRSAVPGIAIRTTLIAGFPGETEAEFQELLDFLTEAQLDRVGCFAFSPVEGAKANELPDAVPAELRDERQARFMAHQERISEQRLQARVGREIDVLVDRLAENDKAERIAVGRSSADAPEIDGLVYVTGVRNALQPGELLRARVTAAQAHDLVAVAIP